MLPVSKSSLYKNRHSNKKNRRNNCSAGKNSAGAGVIFVWIVLGAAQLAAAAWLFYDNMYAMFFMSPWLYFYMKGKHERYYAQKKQELTSEFKDAMTAVSFSLNAGYSVENSFYEALRELKLLYGDNAEIVTEFSEIVRRLENNEDIESALSAFAVKSEVPDILYFSEVFQYAKRSGGDLVSIIRSTADTIRAKLELDEEIQTMISGKKMEQKIMGIMPFAIIAYLKFTSPEFITPLYGNILGVIIMSICLCVYLTADKLAKRIVNIEI